MWIVAVLLLMSFALFLFGRIAKSRRMFWVFAFLGLAVWNVALFLTWKNDYVFNAILGSAVMFGAISDLIAIPILRRRVIAPCVRVTKLQGRIANIILPFFFIASIIFFVALSFYSFGMMLLLGPMIASMIIVFILALFEKTDICGNGVWCTKLQPWEEYESFSWNEKSDDGVELRLISKSWIAGQTRLMVSPEDREAVQQLLEANLPDQSSGAEDRNT
jgi:hypothetical protein